MSSFHFGEKVETLSILTVALGGGLAAPADTIPVCSQCKRDSFR